MVPLQSRRQATLYLPSPDRERVDSLRSRFNPVQFDLIEAHVTLCREDEVLDWNALSSRLSDVGAIEVALTFGRPVRDQNLVYLPAIGSVEHFDALRNSLLSTEDSRPRKHDPHITLIHPRNGICTDSMFEEIASQMVPFSTTFRRVALIEQYDGGKWRDVDYPLG